MNFQDFQLLPALTKAVSEMGYVEPTAIQQQAIPLVLEGHDILAGAQTGTGKTAAFSLPILHRLATSRSSLNDQGSIAIRALILTPTRELAAQIQENIQNYAKYLQLKSCVIFGGVGAASQIKQLQKGTDILVATPGRLLDLHEQGHIQLDAVQILVLDEADRMLDMGFVKDVRRILALLPSNKQSLLFSATFSEEITELANGLLREPQRIQVTPKNSTVQSVEQVAYLVSKNKKKDLLLQLIQTHQWQQTLVFTRTKFGANEVARYLNEQGVSAMALHGNKSQTARTLALDQFKVGDLRVLVATDIAARGIDIDELACVVNYEIPNIPEDYIHRIGRTGRAGASGQAFSLVCVDEQGFMQAIESFTQQKITVSTLEGFAPEDNEVAEPIALGRQVLWGGLGKTPPREVMAQYAKQARQEMLQRQRARNQARQIPRNNRSAVRDEPSSALDDDVQSDGAASSQSQLETGFNPPNERRRSETRRRGPQHGRRDHRRSTVTNGEGDKNKSLPPQGVGFYKSNEWTDQNNGLNSESFDRVSSDNLNQNDSNGTQTPSDRRNLKYDKSKRFNNKNHRSAGKNTYKERADTSPQNDDFQPRNISHQAIGFVSDNAQKASRIQERDSLGGGQPDPLRTSIDSMSKQNNRKHRRGNGMRLNGVDPMTQGYLGDGGANKPRRSTKKPNKDLNRGSNKNFNTGSKNRKVQNNLDYGKSSQPRENQDGNRNLSNGGVSATPSV